MAAGAGSMKKDERYTYADYCAWDTDKRYELIDGVPYLMSPAPANRHQRVLIRLTRAFENYLDGKSCELYIAPTDVRLNPDTEDDTVVQPDLLVVCDAKKITGQSIDGAPDLVIEILSPSTRDYDSGLKLNLYLRAGVRECWIVDTELHTVRVYTRDADGVEAMRVYGENDTIAVGILPGCAVSLREVFAGRPRTSPAP